MLKDTGNPIQIPSFLDAATYVGVAAMSLLGISGLPTLRSKLIGLGLCLVFGLLYRFVFRTNRYEKRPDLYFGAQGLVLAFLFLLGSTSSDAFNFLFLLLSIQAAVVLNGRSAALWIALYFVTVSVAVLTTRGTDGIYAVLFYLVTYVVCGFFGSVLRQAELARDRNQRLVEELQATQRRVQELAVLEERNRLARDLHDSVKQQVFAISMQLSAARASLTEKDAAYAPLAQAEKLAQQAGIELTSLIRELRPPGLEKKPLVPALKDYIAEWSRQNGIATELEVQDDPAMDIASEQALFRVVQEALANVARHSRARKVLVTLKSEHDGVTLSIEDNGIGFDEKQITKGVGLDSMEERLTAVNGILQVSSLQPQGTRVTATLRRA